MKEVKQHKMNYNRIKLAEEHALSVLGEEQYKNNKDAVKSIKSDFLAGFGLAHKLLMATKAKQDRIKSNHNRMLTYLRRIKSYQTATQLRKDSTKDGVFDFEEAIEMAYENIQLEAKEGCKGISPIE